MIDWRYGGWTGSLNRFARHEVRKQLRENPVARRVRYGLAHRILRWFLGAGTFRRFVGLYIAVNFLFVVAEGLSAWLIPCWLQYWRASGFLPATDTKDLILDVSGYLLGAQIGVLGVISLPLALVTLIAQREGSATDIQVYYHESFSFELVASCVALCAILCAQLLWPMQFLLHLDSLESDLQIFKMGLLTLHLTWLIVNLAALAHFIATTFRFVQQSDCERLREFYTANVVLPQELEQRLREHLYSSASTYLVGSDDGCPSVTFGYDYGEPGIAELETSFKCPMALHDVRMIWVRWVIRRWSVRCEKATLEAPASRFRGSHDPGPLIWFTPNIDQRLAGQVSWCRRRGGVPLNAVERFVLRRAFRFRVDVMNPEFTRPEAIMEDLVDKTRAQIERLAPVAFDKAFEELTRYHNFLLALSASRTPDDAAFNFSEVSGNAWSSPHEEWIRQYGRLFERAANRLVDDDHFIRRLAYAPVKLLPRAGNPELSPNVMRAILNLGPILVSRLEVWVTKRTIVETREGQSAEPPLALAGTDAKAYRNVLPEIIGVWESLLHWYPPLTSRSRERGELGEAERWAGYRSSWAFLWQHLTNTAYCLAIAVWNEDEIGAAVFREALERWHLAFNHHMNVHIEARRRWLLFPNLMKLDWAAASAAAASLGYGYPPSPCPEQLFTSVLRGAKEDVTLLTAALLLSWTMNGKQASDIGARNAKALLRREASEDDRRVDGMQDVGFRSLFLHLLRFELAGKGHQDGSYAAELDRLVDRLDTMTERRVVPGRVFTPSTMHERDGLLLSDLAILLAYAPNEGDDGVLKQITALAHEEEVLPEGDGSLRDILHRLERYRSALEQSSPELVRGMSPLAHGPDPERAKARLREIIIEATAAVEVERRQRLEARAPDPEKLERIRAAIETALLTNAPEIQFFRSVEVGRTAEGQNTEWRDIEFNGIAKAQLLEPPMEPPASGFEEMLVTNSHRRAGATAWQAFCRRARVEIKVSAPVEEKTFWREIAPLISQVGPEPVLVVSQNAEGRVLRRFLYAPATDRPELNIEKRPRGGIGRDYIATIEGVDVFGLGGLQAGKAWLFSAEALRAIRYAEVNPTGHCAELNFELGEQMKGMLRVRVRQELEWSDSLIFELEAPDRGE
jgi:hypothetical protein